MVTTRAGRPEDVDQRIYARLLGWGANAGLFALVAFFFIYVLEVVPPLIAHEQLPELWTAPASEFLRTSGMSHGWDWTNFVHHSDILNLVGIVLLAFCSMPCLLAMLPVYWSARQRALFAVCVLELLVLGFAASGLLVVH
jgi:hypothetical protein